WLLASVKSGYLLLPPPDEYYVAKSKRTQETQERDYDKYGEDEGCGFSVEEGSGEDDEEAGLSGKLKAVLNGLTTLRQTGTDDKLIVGAQEAVDRPQWHEFTATRGAH
ncbi:hypothetical protein FOZ63_018709, partial [Perkinsus olseni]